MTSIVPPGWAYYTDTDAVEEHPQALTALPPQPSRFGFTASPTSIFAGLVPWGHNLRIIRNGAIHWAGPVVSVEDQGDSFLVTAIDTGAWTTKKLLQSDVYAGYIGGGYDGPSGDPVGELKIQWTAVDELRSGLLVSESARFFIAWIAEEARQSDLYHDIDYSPPPPRMFSPVSSMPPGGTTVGYGKGAYNELTENAGNDDNEIVLNIEDRRTILDHVRSLFPDMPWTVVGSRFVSYVEAFYEPSPVVLGPNSFINGRLSANGDAVADVAYLPDERSTAGVGASLYALTLGSTGGANPIGSRLETAEEGRFGGVTLSLSGAGVAPESEYGLRDLIPNRLVRVDLLSDELLAQSSLIPTDVEQDLLRIASVSVVVEASGGLLNESISVSLSTVGYLGTFDPGDDPPEPIEP